MSTLFSHFFQKINQISPLEADFTEVLDTIALKPKILYFYGKMPENVLKNSKTGVNSIISTGIAKRPKTVAIVGSRHNTKYGEEVAYRLAFELAKKGVIIVSGLAYGIDSIAHRGCLDAGGTTIAVLGTPIDQIYPVPHKPLAAEIIEKGGAVISEYAPNTKEYVTSPLAPGEAGWNGHMWLKFSDPVQPIEKRHVDRKLSFLYRNRLISGLSGIVVVVEAAEKSGSLNTATHALEQGKDVFAVPGNITSPYSQGCNKLIRQGAYPYTEPDDILRELFPEDFAKKQKKLAQAKLFGDTDVETKILQALASGARTPDEIMNVALLPPEVFSEAITLLELKSRVRPTSANTWSLI